MQLEPNKGMELTNNKSQMSDARFTQTSGAFAMTCRVEVNIESTAEIVWSLLTDAKAFSRWNSTVTDIEGEIREGERLRLRTFALKPRDNASTDFVMEERFSGVVFALTKSMLPDFRPIFEAYANDLKREAQRVAHARVSC